MKRDLPAEAFDTAVVGAAIPHDSAHLHVAGSATYIDDIPEVAGTLHAAVGMSTVARGRLLSLGLARVRAAPGVVWFAAAGYCEHFQLLAGGFRRRIPG